MIRVIVASENPVKLAAVRRAFQRMYPETGFEIVAVDLQEPARTVKDFLEKNGYTFPVLLDSTGRVGGLYGARSIPTSYLVAPDGNVIAGIVGTREWDTEELTSVLRSLLPNG